MQFSVAVLAFAKQAFAQQRTAVEASGVEELVIDRLAANVLQAPSAKRRRLDESVNGKGWLQAAGSGRQASDRKSFSGQKRPRGWPGQLYLEGRTLIHLEGDERPKSRPRGPIKKTSGCFFNPAMAGSRTRSVLLLQDALKYGWVNGHQPIRALDAVCATGSRVQRWRKEISPELQVRLHITANDLDASALDWGIQTMREHPPASTALTGIKMNETEGIEANGIKFQQYDARAAMIMQPFQWVDLDPFGAPVKFLDSALQSLGRVGVLEVTATDTSAFCCTSSRGASRDRRYGYKAYRDGYIEDDAIRALLADVAIHAAKLDRVVSPILAIYGGHYLRVSVLVRRSGTEASQVQENIGWRVRYDDVPYRFERYPRPEHLNRSSGPLWIGPVWNATICARLTEEAAVRSCVPRRPDQQEAIDLGMPWSRTDYFNSKKEVQKAVRHISGAARLMGSEHLLLSHDDLPKWAGVDWLIAMDDIIQGLRKRGFEAARVPDYDNNLIATKAPFETVLNVYRALGPTATFNGSRPAES